MELNVAAEIDFGQNIMDVEVPEKLRLKIPTGIEYVDASFGGRGMTPSVVTLFTGTPGAGKTTMVLLIADALARLGNVCVYNGAEESAYQTKMTAERLRLRAGFGMGQENNVDHLLEKFDAHVKKTRHADQHPVLIVDSLQALSDGRFGTGRITSRTAELVLEKLTNYAKSTYCNIIVVGQVNKSGKMAGSNKLKHMVDSHLELSVETDEKSDFYNCRKLFMSKNRFGGAGFLSFLRIGEHGFQEVARVGNIAEQ